MILKRKQYALSQEDIETMRLINKAGAHKAEQKIRGINSRYSGLKSAAQNTLSGAKLKEVGKYEATRAQKISGVVNDFVSNETKISNALQNKNISYSGKKRLKKAISDAEKYVSEHKI